MVSYKRGTPVNPKPGRSVEGMTCNSVINSNSEPAGTLEPQHLTLDPES